MMNNLDELENLARGAAEVWDGNSEYHFRMSDCGPIVAERMGQFCDKANPETVLKLIAVARAAEQLLPWADDYDKNPLLENLRKSFDVLRGADPT